MEIDSLCYPLRLAYQYWKVTGDSSIFDGEWMKAITAILKTFKEQQRKDGVGPYRFQRKTERALDTLNNDGWCSGQTGGTDCFRFPPIGRCHYASVPGPFQLFRCLFFEKGC